MARATVFVKPKSEGGYRTVGTHEFEHLPEKGTVFSLAVKGRQEWFETITFSRHPNPSDAINLFAIEAIAPDLKR